MIGDYSIVWAAVIWEGFFLTLQGICETSTPCVFCLPVNLLIFPFHLIRNTGFNDASSRRLNTPGHSLCVPQVVEIHWLHCSHLGENKEGEKLTISLWWIANPSLGYSRENRRAAHAEDELLDPIIMGRIKKKGELLRIISTSCHLRGTPSSRQAAAVIHATSYVVACP